MSEMQLREAHKLMKLGQKPEAIRIVQNVLREDRSNVNAWWLFSVLLEDEEKIIRALEKILALNPEHLGAKKRLAEMRGDTRNLIPASSSAPAKSEANPTNLKNNRASSTALVVGFIIFAVLLMFSILMPNFATMIDEYNLANVVGAGPEEVARLQLEAALNGDYETMRLHTCDNLDRDWEYNMNDMRHEIESGGVSWDAIDIDISGFTFTLDEGKTLERYFEVSGPMVMRYQGQEFSANIEDMSFFNLYIIMVIEGNHWKVCSL